MSLIASQSNPNLNRMEHEQCILVDSMSGDLADALASVFPRFVTAFCFVSPLVCMQFAPLIHPSRIFCEQTERAHQLRFVTDFVF